MGFKVSCKLREFSRKIQFPVMQLWKNLHLYQNMSHQPAHTEQEKKGGLYAIAVISRQRCHKL